MMSIFYREYLEHRLHFVIFIVAGLSTVGLLGLFQQAYPDVVLTLLFLVEIPCLAIMVGGHMVSTEVLKGTFPFLASLPLSRFRIWVGKASFGFVFCEIIVLAFALIGMAAGVPGFSIDWQVGDLRWGDSFWFAPAKFSEFSAAMILFGYPLVLFSGSFFATMLPKGVGTLVGMGALVILWIFGVNFGFAAVNLPLAAGLLSASFLVSSWAVFRRGELMDSWKRVLTGGGVLALCLTVSLGIWAGLDGWAEKNPIDLHLDARNSIPVDGGRMMLVRGVSTSGALDPIVGMGIGQEIYGRERVQNSVRLFLKDTRTGSLRQIGRRGTVTEVVSPNGEWLAQVALNSFPGVRGKARLLLHHKWMGEGDQVYEVDHDAAPNLVEDDGSVIYHRYILAGEKWVTTEFCKFVPGSGTTVLHSVLGTETNGSRVHLLKAMGALVIEPEEWTGDAMLITLDDGKRHYLKSGSTIQVEIETPEMAVFRARENPWATASWLVGCDRAGKAIPMDWCSSSTSFLGKMSDGRMLTFVAHSAEGENPTEGPTPVPTYENQFFRLEVCDPVQKTFSPLECYPRKMFGNGTACHLSSSGNTLLVFETAFRENPFYLVDLRSGKVTDLPITLRMSHSVRRDGSDSFLISIEKENWRVDGNTGEIRKVFEWSEEEWTEIADIPLDQQW